MIIPAPAPTIAHFRIEKSGSLYRALVHREQTVRRLDSLRWSLVRGRLLRHNDKLVHHIHWLILNKFSNDVNCKWNIPARSHPTDYFGLYITLTVTPGQYEFTHID